MVASSAMRSSFTSLGGSACCGDGLGEWVCQRITNGQALYANVGSVVDAHGSGFYKDDATGKYWWLGEGRENNTEGNTQLRLYSSADLMNWHYEGTPVDSGTSGDTGTYFPECNAKGERSKIAKNYKGDWIILAHWETSPMAPPATWSCRPGVSRKDRISLPPPMWMSTVISTPEVSVRAWPTTMRTPWTIEPAS